MEKADRAVGRERDTGHGGGADDGVCVVFAFDEDRVRRAREAMPGDDELRDIADTFQILGHPTRVRIILALAREELCVCDLAQVLGLSVSATSHQLRAMRGMRLVTHRTAGRFAYYSLCDPFVSALLKDCARHLSGEGAEQGNEPAGGLRAGTHRVQGGQHLPLGCAVATRR